ncbi:beta-microseminoprotein isoform X2 [Colius striatus]|uniref:beta-microseminoprotein isoform X2 n=1 Tax=Colius striatus TaxID=57412 RepID=UPI002B1D8FB9|nr:beta-microseminoprotein isoform X2 [Colius striatus]
MKSFLTFLVAMGIIVTPGDAYCFTKINKPGESDKGCILQGKLYPFGEIARTESCFSCSCSRDAMRCCSLFHTPIGFDEENCKVIFNKRRCDYDLVQKSDLSKACDVYSRVG